MVLDPAGPIPERRLFHRRRAVAGAYRCFHRSIQRDSRAIRLDQEKGLPAAVQKSPYHSTLILDTRFPRSAVTLSSLTFVVLLGLWLQSYIFRYCGGVLFLVLGDFFIWQTCSEL